MTRFLAMALLVAGAVSPCLGWTQDSAVPASLIARTKFFGNPSKVAGKTEPGRPMDFLDRTARRRLERLGRACRRSRQCAAADGREEAADPHHVLVARFEERALHQRQRRRRELPALRRESRDRRAEEPDAVRQDPRRDRRHQPAHQGPDPRRHQQPRCALARRLQPRPRERQADAGAAERRLRRLRRRRGPEPAPGCPSRATTAAATTTASTVAGSKRRRWLASDSTTR